MSSKYSFVQNYKKIIESYELQEEGILYSKGDKDYFVPFIKIKHIRLRYFPGRIKTNQYETHIELESGKKLRIGSVTFVGFGNFEDQANEYGAFIRALLETIDKKNPNVVLQFGHTMERFVFGLISQILIFGTLGYVIFMMPVAGGLVFAKLLYIVFFIPYLVKYFITNRPGGEDKEDLNRVLPQ